MDKARSVSYLLLHTFYLLLLKCNDWKGDWTLGYVSTQIWDFCNISYFPKILSLKVFGNLWGNSYTKFVILDIKFRSLWQIGPLQRAVKFQDIMTRIFCKFFFSSLHFQWWFKFLEKNSFWLKKVNSTKKLSVSKIESSVNQVLI